MRLGNWDFIKSLLWQYIHTNNFYVFYLHPFEMTREKVPVLRNLKSYDKYYLRFGIHTYKRKVQWIIALLKKCGYQFVTFEELTRIMNGQTAQSAV